MLPSQRRGCGGPRLPDGMRQAHPPPGERTHRKPHGHPRKEPFPPPYHTTPAAQVLTLKHQPTKDGYTPDSRNEPRSPANQFPDYQPRPNPEPDESPRESHFPTNTTTRRRHELSPSGPRDVVDMPTNPRPPPKENQRSTCRMNHEDERRTHTERRRPDRTTTA